MHRTLYFALYDGDGAEFSYPGYRRQPITLDANGDIEDASFVLPRRHAMVIVAIVTEPAGPCVDIATCVTALSEPQNVVTVRMPKMQAA
jgi:hypothetical protein